MAQDRFPDCLPVVFRVDTRGDGPLGPSHATSLHAIDMHDYVTKDGLIGHSQLLCWCHVIPFRDRMGSQLAMVEGGGIGRFNNGSPGELANGDMIWMPRRRVW